MQIYDGRESFYQWDINQKITSPNLKVGDEVHFANSIQSTALVTMAYELNGKVVVDVPTILLQKSYPIKAWRYVTVDDLSFTIDEHTFKVNQRTKPDDYVYTETEILSYNSLDERLKKIEEDGTGEISEEQIATAVKNYFSENPIDFTETDPTVSDWAKQPEKPTYTAAEVGALPSDTTIPDASPIKYVESLNLESTETLVALRDLESGTYVLYGKFTPYKGSSASFTFSTKMLVSIIRTNTITYVQVFYSKYNSIQHLEITDDNYTRKDAKLVNMESVANKTSTLDENSTDEQYPTAKAVYDTINSNTLHGTASGLDVIRVDDVNPIEHTVKAKVKSKNLVDIADFAVAGSSAWEATRVLFNGTTGKYTLRCDFEQKSEISTIQVSAKDYLTGSIFYGSKTSADNSGTIIFTFEIPEGSNNAYIYFYSNYTGDSITTDCMFSNIQVEEGDTATEYTPYIDPSTVTVTRCGKNIAPTNEYVVSHSYAWANTSAIKTTAPKGNYVAKCKFSQNGELTTVCMSVRDYDNYTAQLNQQYSFDAQGTLIVPFTVGENCNGFQIYLYSNMTETALAAECVFSDFQIEIGDTATDFEAYNGSTYTPEADGTVNGITSVSPTMTLLTDKAGVTIEAEYNQDINAAFDEVNAILETLLNGGA